TISTGGENSDQQAFFAEIGILFLVVLLLVYLVIAFQFKSFTLPFLVLFAVYLGISGAILGLFITQTPLSFLGVMGIVFLISLFFFFILFLYFWCLARLIYYANSS